MFSDQSPENSPVAADNKYVVALKREQRENAPENWVEILKETAGVTITGGDEKMGRVLVITATPEGLKALKEKLGEYCHIEEPVLFRLSESNFPERNGEK